MPPNIPNQSHADPLQSLINRYLTVDGQIQTDALEVVQRWYVYLNTLTDSMSLQIRAAQGKVGIEAVEMAFETPLAGFQGNLFWQQYGSSILPLVQRDLVTQHLLANYAKQKPELSYGLTVTGNYSFIGLVVSLVQRDGLKSWKAFELEFRELMERTAKEYLDGNTSNH